MIQIFCVTPVAKNLDEIDTDVTSAIPKSTAENAAFEAQSVRMYNMYGRPYEM